ncbi:protein CIP2A [Etheostoma spectabile]|uniref:protein CIP2A n=1 Tax=Etheostoma spectabile TaxID=54343 RepID=UPI0013AF3469|nr:protein CIP2A [Etheostoma spectabile]
MDMATSLKSLLLAVQQYRDGRTAQNAAQLQKQVEEVSGLKCDQLLSSGQVLPRECVSGLVELAGNPNTSQTLTSSIISLLAKLACDDDSREILNSSYNLTSTLASVIHCHSATAGEPLVLQCLQVLQKLTYNTRVFQSTNYIHELIAFLMANIQSQNEDIIVPCLGLMANLCRDNHSVQSHIKSLDNVKRFYRTLINFLAHNSLTVVIFTLSILASLTLNEKVGEKLFDAKNIHQTFQLVFNIIVNGNGTQTRKYSVDLLVDLLKNTKIADHLTKYQHFSACVSQVLGLLQSKDPDSAGKVHTPFNMLHIILNSCPQKDCKEVDSGGLRRHCRLFGSLQTGAGLCEHREDIDNMADWLELFLGPVPGLGVRFLLFGWFSDPGETPLEQQGPHKGRMEGGGRKTRPRGRPGVWGKKEGLGETRFYRMLQDQRIVTPLSLALTSQHRERVQTGLSLLFEATPLPDFPSLVLGESMAANNSYRQREAELSVKRVAVQEVPPFSILDCSSGSSRSVHSLVDKIQNGLELQEPVKDSHVSEIIDVYEQKLSAFASKESRLQDLLDAKALALSQADRLIAQYRFQRAQAEAEACKLGCLLKEAERRREDLQGELSSQVLEVERSKADMEELLQHNARLQQDSEEHQALKGAYNSLLNRFNESERLLKELQAAHISLTKQNDALRKNHEALQLQHEKMASVLEEREEEIRSLRSDLQQKNSDITGLRGELRAEEEKVKEKDRERRELEETVDVLRKELNKTEQARKDASIKASSLELQKSQLETKLKQKEDELSKHSSMIAMIHSLSSGKLKSDVNLSL